MWIDRIAERHVLELASHFPAVLVTGARQTGKTALLRHVFPDAEAISLDLPSAAAAAESAPEELIGERTGPVVLDEVQYAPGLFRQLKLRIDAKRHAMGRFLMTGSQKLALMRAASESLAGRCAIVELETLSASELRAALAKPPTLLDLMHRGAFPELHRDRELPSRVFYSSYVATYLERDVRSLSKVGSLRDFERFLRACALRSGQLVNLADVARDVGIAGSTARDWLSVLEASSIIVLLEPWFGNIGKRMIKTPKLYFRDTGLACFLLGLETPQGLERSSFIGAIWETFVLHQMMCAATGTGAAASIYFFRDAQGTEVDFVIEREGRLRLVEAKWAESVDSRVGHTIEKVASLLGRRAADEHWVACRTAHTHAMGKGVHVKLVNGYRWDRWLEA